MLKRISKMCIRVLLGLGALLLAGVTPALAAEVHQGDTVVIGPDQVINDDVYAFGTNIQLMGTVNGDVFAAGNSVTVAGVVTGGVFAAGNTVSVSADVQRGVHAAGGTVTIAGPVSEDATIAGGTLIVAPAARIGRDALFAAGTANIAASVGRDLRASSSDLTLAAPVGGNVQAEVGTLRVTTTGRVDGSTTYTSQRDAEISPGAAFGGGIQRLQPPVATQPGGSVASGYAGALDWIRGLVGLAVIGLLLTLVLPRFSETTVQTARSSVWSSLGLGFGLLVGVPFLAVVMFIAGIFLGGWWLGFAVLAMYAIACAVGYVIAAIVAGQMAVDVVRQPRQHLAWNLLEGLAVFGLVGLVPVVGPVLVFVATIFGLGSLTLSIAALYRGSQPSPVVRTMTTPSLQPAGAIA